MNNIVKTLILRINENENDRNRRKRSQKIEKLRQAVKREEEDEKLRYELLVKQRSNVHHIFSTY
jgi:hypothetical protein